jgi:cytochrome c oxidase subunit II
LIQAKALWPGEGGKAPAAPPCDAGVTVRRDAVTALSTAGRRVTKSALQQTLICGLRNWDSPIPPTPAKDRKRLRKPAQVPPKAGGVMPLRSALKPGSALIVDGRDKDQKQGAERQMKVFLRLTAMAVTAGALIASAGAALAGLGQPSPWQMDLQDSASPVMAEVASFHYYLLWVIAAISLFVLVLLGIIVVRFNARTNPTPSRTTHNTPIEIAWTIIPVVILAAIAVPSFRLLFTELDVPTPDLTIKATGKQWFWSYSYPDNGNFEFDSLMVAEKDLKPGQPRLLTADNEMVVPINKVVHVLVTGADVIHSFAVPSLGIRIDAVPGRMNETWFKATIEGTFYGQCSELCGKDHSFMPIAVRVVKDSDFTAWVADAKKKYATDESVPPNTFAAAGAPSPR